MAIERRCYRRMGGAWLGCVMMMMMTATTMVQAATVTRAAAGTSADGAAIEAVTLTNAQGVSARVLTYGATLQSLIAPDRHGRPADLLLGYDEATDYQRHPNFFGVTVGRYANRIAGGRFMLDGQTYRVPVNNGANSLHGGGNGFDKKLWRIVSVESGSTASVVLALTSPDGDAGYPGKLDVNVTYTLDESSALTIAFAATTTKPTVLNLTNHAVWNLSGEGSPAGAMAHRLTIAAARFTPVDAGLIPSGERRPVAGTPFDFRQPRPIADGLRDGRDEQLRFGHGYDHNFALDKGLTPQPQLAARLEDPASGRVLEVLTTEPGLQFYTTNFLDGSLVGKHGHLYRMGDGVALEPQKFPNAPNQAGFVSARIDPGTPYRHVMIYRLSTRR